MRTVLRVGLAATLLGCVSSSAFISTWTNPDAFPVVPQGQKILAVVQLRDNTRRDAAEDALAAEITKRGARGIPAHELFPDFKPPVDTIVARQRAKEAGMAGVVIMRFTGREQTVTAVATPVSPWLDDPYYRRPWGAWGRGWDTAYEAESLRVDVKVTVETRVYSLEQDKLLWAGTSETWNPARSGDVVRELARELTKQLQKAGLMPKEQ